MNTLKHLQQVILSILVDIDDLCKKNDIRYYLAYGSALGAIRHKGFIPWDEDIDIIMDNENYEKFILCARNQLDSNKYYVEEGLVDWPMPFSKIKLRGTIFAEIEGYSTCGENGIFVDVFKMDAVPNGWLASHWQYVCAKYYLCYALSERTFKSAALRKKILMWLSFPLKWKILRTFVLQQVTKYNNKKSCDYFGCFYTRYRYKNSVIPKVMYGNPVMVHFEETMMPVPEKWDDYLTYIYGDYMTPPPVEKQVGLHLDGMNIDFGPY